MWLAYTPGVLAFWDGKEDAAFLGVQSIVSPRTVGTG